MVNFSRAARCSCGHARPRSATRCGCYCAPGSPVGRRRPGRGDRVRLLRPRGPRHPARRMTALVRVDVIRRDPLAPEPIGSELDDWAATTGRGPRSARGRPADSGPPAPAPAPAAAPADGVPAPASTLDELDDVPVINGHRARRAERKRGRPGGGARPRWGLVGLCLSPPACASRCATGPPPSAPPPCLCDEAPGAVGAVDLGADPPRPRRERPPRQGHADLPQHAARR